MVLEVKSWEVGTGVWKVVNGSGGWVVQEVEDVGGQPEVWEIWYRGL